MSSADSQKILSRFLGDSQQILSNLCKLSAIFATDQQSLQVISNLSKSSAIIVAYRTRGTIVRSHIIGRSRFIAAKPPVLEYFLQL